MSTPPSPLNWIYLLYTIAAAALTAINVRETAKQEGKDKFFVLSRIGTMILTVGTFFDNFRSWLGSFPSAIYPAEVLAAPNVSEAQKVWADMDFQGAGFATTMFWFCDANHEVFAAIAIFTVVYFVVSTHYTPTSDEPLPPARRTRKTFIFTAILILIIMGVQTFGFIKGPVAGKSHGALDLEEPLEGIYRVTAIDHNSTSLLAVFAYSFGMIGFGLYQMVLAYRRDGCSPCKCSRSDVTQTTSNVESLLWLLIVFITLPMNALSGGATGFRSVIGNMGEQMLFGSVLWYDLRLAKRASESSGVYLEV
eukprot:g3795.t1